MTKLRMNIGFHFTSIKPQILSTYQHMRRSRFTLFCLDDGDEYFGDSIVDYYCPFNTNNRAPGASSSVKARSGDAAPQPKIRGRLRLAGRALFFEPDDWSRPIYLFRYKEIIRSSDAHRESFVLTTEEVAFKIANGLLSAAQVPSVETGSYFLFKCETTLTQMVNGEYAPYGSEQWRKEHVFAFPYGDAAKLIDKVAALLYVERSADRHGQSRRDILSHMLDVKERETPFALTMLQSQDENILKQALCTKVGPLTLQRGRLVVTDSQLYFQATFPLSTQVEAVDLRKVRRVERRRYQFREVGLEIATVDDEIVLFAFAKASDREEVFGCLGGHPQLERVRVNNLETMTNRWQRGRLSTFDYLMFLNWVAGRSMNDLTQYPVLPWVLADYTSDVLDLNSPASYRDFSKPVGALNPQRLKSFINRANDLRSIGETPYLYGSHYSNPAYVTYYLVRQHPEYMLVLHTGKLDHGSRMFESVAGTFQSVLTGPTDLKELIPEFFYGNGEFLRFPAGNRSLDLGVKSDGSRVSRDVILPPWANDDPREFIRLNRLALESDFVSRNVHKWIDLIFGFQQDGSEAWAAHNVFHPYTYESSVSSTETAALDETKKLAMEMHSKEFGQMPKKLFCSGHPQRQHGKTPPHLITLEKFIPPDSDEFESGTPSRTQPLSMTNSAEACEEGTTTGTSRCIAYINGGGGGEGVLSQQSPRDSPRGQAGGSSAVDVARMVDDALSLEHVLGAASEDCHGADIHPDGSSSDHHANNPVALEVISTTKTGCKGKLECLAIGSVPCDSDWIFEDFDDGVLNVPIVFAGDSSGALNVMDPIHAKRLRTINDFGQAALSALRTVAGDTMLLVGSLSGAIFSVNLQGCTVECENEDVCGSGGVLALAANDSVVVLGGTTGCVSCFSLQPSSSHNQGVVVDRSPLVDELDLNYRVERLDVDSSGRRILSVSPGGEVTIASLRDHHESISFALDAHVAKRLALCAFSKDHTVTAVGSYDVFHYSLDGSVWGHFPAPHEVAFAALTKGGFLPSDCLVLASPEGVISVVHCSSGRVVASGAVDATVLGSATVTCGAVGTEAIAVGDSAGRVFVLQVRQ